MADTTDNTLRAAIKALTEVIAPAVDPKAALANEQLRLVVESLEFVRNRLDLLYERDRFELRHHLAMARALGEIQPACSDHVAAALRAAIDAGDAAWAMSGASMPELKAAAAGLAAAIRALVREAQGFEAQARQRVERCVLEASEERIAFDRAWYLPLGFDPAPGEVRPLSELLAGSGE